VSVEGDGDVTVVRLHDGTQVSIAGMLLPKGSYVISHEDAQRLVAQGKLPHGLVAGEDGPELVDLPRDTAVHATSDAKKTLGEQVTDALIADVPDGTVNEVLDWVDGDPERALQALLVEQESDKPRSTLVAKLDELMSQ
jgi:hypothetical protein